MNYIKWETVIVCIVMSSITAYIIVVINLRNLSNKLNEFREDMIETCTTEVAKCVDSIINKFK